MEESEFQPMFDDVKGELSGKKIALFGSYGWGDGEVKLKRNKKGADAY